MIAVLNACKTSAKKLRPSNTCPAGWIRFLNVARPGDGAKRRIRTRCDGVATSERRSPSSWAKARAFRFKSRLGRLMKRFCGTCPEPGLTTRFARYRYLERCRRALNSSAVVCIPAGSGAGSSLHPNSVGHGHLLLHHLQPPQAGQARRCRCSPRPRTRARTNPAPSPASRTVPHPSAALTRYLATLSPCLHLHGYRRGAASCSSPIDPTPPHPTPHARPSTRF